MSLHVSVCLSVSLDVSVCQSVSLDESVFLSVCLFNYLAVVLNPKSQSEHVFLSINVCLEASPHSPNQDEFSVTQFQIYWSGSVYCMMLSV